MDAGGVDAGELTDLFVKKRQNEISVSLREYYNTNQIHDRIEDPKTIRFKDENCETDFYFSKISVSIFGTFLVSTIILFCRSLYRIVVFDPSDLSVAVRLS